MEKCLIGLDIGTTTISGVLIEERTERQIDTHTLEHNSYITGLESFRREQDPERIYRFCREILDYFCREERKICAIGLTGQMHGILYLDKNGRAVSNLITWEDGRGNLPYKDGKTYSGCLTEFLGTNMATGYGMTTVFVDQDRGEIPQGAVSFCTIGDYVAMRLCGLVRPLIHVSNGASLGMFDVYEGNFDRDAVKKAGIEESFLPEICREERIIGNTPEGIPVVVPIGDNQASFLGTMEKGGRILVNIGTGSQISVFTEEPVKSDAMELRPYIQGNYLLIGCGLCGGAAYQLLHNFMKEIIEACGGTGENLYQKMQEMAEKAEGAENPPLVDTRFRGTRKNPRIQGGITGLTPENFTPGAVTLGFLQGICRELHDYYETMAEDMKGQTSITGSGNGIRKNPVLQDIIEKTFGKKLVIPETREEAAQGAAKIGKMIDYSVYTKE